MSGPDNSPNGDSELDPQFAAEDTNAETIPTARIRTPDRVQYGKLKTRLWWLTALCGLLAIFLIASGLRSQGLLIQIRFDDGYGLKAGDTLRYRGIDVGAVKSITISDELDQVVVGVLVLPGNERLAVKGSQFWIERPRLRLGQVSGLETVLGAKYIGVIPGEAEAPRVTEFVGLSTPLNIADADSTQVQIQFPAGEGLAIGDPVRYRGIAIGEVTDVRLSPQVDAVVVDVRLVGASQKLARVGTQFWVERPRLDLTEIRGLETLLGGRYVAIQPTLDESEPQFEFIGLAEPPPLPRRDGSLELELDASNRLGLVRGAPVSYRGLEVGRVSNVGLSHDGATVKISVVVDAEYADLVRDNSKWWASGGIKIDANLRGLHFAIDSLAAWVRGGIAFATPDTPGKRVVTGHRFVMQAEPLPEWLEWQPRIAVGHSKAYGIQLPRPTRIVARWQTSFLGISRERTLQTWGLTLEDGYAYLPNSFIRSVREVESDVRIEIAGQSFAWKPSIADSGGLTGKLRLPDSLRRASSWSAEKVGSWRPDALLLVVNPELSEPLALDATRVAVSEGQDLEIATGISIDPGLEGSPVVSAESGTVVGLLVASDGQWFVGGLLR